VPQFSYTARDSAGKVVTGEIEAAEEQLAIASVLNRGLMVVSIEQKAGKKKKAKSSQSVKTVDLVVFTRQLATMMDAGLPLVQCLTALNEQTTSKGLKEVLEDVTAQVERGDAFSEALSRHPKVFDKLYISMVKAGETGGLLAEILDRVASYLEASARLRKKVKSAMSYPTIVTIVAISISVFLIVKVIPVFAGIYKDFHAKLPTPTLVLVQISEIFRHYLPFVLVALVILAFAFVKFKKTERGQELWDRSKIKFPVLGKLAHKIALSRFARTFASLIRSGVPILETLQIVGQSSGNIIVAKAVNDAAGNIERGENIAGSLGKHTIFPPMLIRMIAAGEQTGKVDVMLEKISDFYDDEIEATLSGLTALIEPLLIVFLGVVVGGIVICMFLPIFKLSEVVKF
jgi:type IV pilus assembly protein PilC